MRASRYNISYLSRGDILANFSLEGVQQRQLEFIAPQPPYTDLGGFIGNSLQDTACFAVVWGVGFQLSNEDRKMLALPNDLSMHMVRVLIFAYSYVEPVEHKTMPGVFQFPRSVYLGDVMIECPLTYDDNNHVTKRTLADIASALAKKSVKVSQ